MSRWQPWEFDEALQFVRDLQNTLEPFGFHVALCGSVLIKGESTNDLDVVVFPHNTGQVDMSPIKDVLEGFGLKLLSDRIRVASVWARKGSTDTKHVESWTTQKNQKVDLFFLR